MGVVAGRVGVEVFVRGGRVNGVHQLPGLLLDFQGSVVCLPDRGSGVGIRLIVGVVVVGQFDGIIVVIFAIFAGNPVSKARPDKSGVPGVSQPGGGLGILAGVCRQGGGAAFRVGSGGLLVQVIAFAGASVGCACSAAGIRLRRPTPRLVGIRRIIRGFLG